MAEQQQQERNDQQHQQEQHEKQQQQQQQQQRQQEHESEQEQEQQQQHEQGHAQVGTQDQQDQLQPETSERSPVRRGVAAENAVKTVTSPPRPMPFAADIMPKSPEKRTEFGIRPVIGGGYHGFERGGAAERGKPCRARHQVAGVPVDVIGSANVRKASPTRAVATTPTKSASGKPPRCSSEVRHRPQDACDVSAVNWTGGGLKTVTAAIDRVVFGREGPSQYPRAGSSSRRCARDHAKGRQRMSRSTRPGGSLLP
eukprot:TRINITY_DN32488_c0_g3_i1.p1 TRINITY_DN32488_c0_g3~~TRINITY_DN32488_c0_g3_i1.p1  ORF type:complete len:275 (-),score=68.25 TRINITY_DN32488_c0_g3_i1:179-946(-)